MRLKKGQMRRCCRTARASGALTWSGTQWVLGANEPEIVSWWVAFCPWCGKPMPEQTPPRRAARGRG